MDHARYGWHDGCCSCSALELRVGRSLLMIGRTVARVAASWDAYRVTLRLQCSPPGSSTSPTSAPLPNAGPRRKVSREALTIHLEDAWKMV